ncbi:winged helix DNA-binding domain-containing protein [Nocardioides sp. CFH 31398]|uniref:winged helix DNA-binding domain-containing protein n=1 Tax=Nocardioides sp. CFH 31398 TaxID=2919579 RepID=UPI001F0617C7|nr:winged helix DNA-binding domain-containing protein [Nocardioides sp. CFH 31398]MCH1868425.1 winged helix DNA-binding domain-containing protein [Nocardioides sp. CFH 31398]
MTLSWEDLAARARARQLPAVAAPTTPGEVAAALHRTGAIQSQTARSTFLGLAARYPGTTHAAITAAFEAATIVRGSTLRGTVHTVAADDHPWHEAVTRLARRKDLQRVLAPQHFAVDDLWSALEAYAAEQPRTADELHTFLASWVAEREGRDAETVKAGVGRSLSYTHGGLVRRPLSGGWEGQGAAGYSPSAVPDRARRVAAPDAVAGLVRAHLLAHGPASRQDLAWWAGSTLGVVDDALEHLGLDGDEGPDGRHYVDLPERPDPVEDVGVRLLPEFDAFMCAYEPSARARFVDAAHHAHLWNSKNATVLPPLLVDGRITGHWRAAGSARRRPLEVTWFARTRRPRKAELEAPVAALGAALGITVTGVTITREVV